MSIYVGLISGTSMDAIDAVLVDLHRQPPTLLSTHLHSIPDRLERALDQAITDSPPDAELIWRLDRELGELFAQAALTLLDRTGVRATEVRAIGSHGQTVRHHPDAAIPYTVQIGDPNTIAELTGITTVADFRRRDVAAGGQGAPLAPPFHHSMFARAGEPRVIVNIGGISNVTVLGANLDDPPKGFDTGPGNTLLDGWCRRHRGTRFDEGGRWAAGGRADPRLLEGLSDDSFFALDPPKSTGRELFNSTWLDERLREHPSQIRAEDVQRTLCELTARTVADAITQYASESKTVLVCGGGAKNPVVMQSLSANLPSRTVESTAAHGLEPDWIEAIAFAWLAKRALAGETGNVPEVTGARRRVVLGAIYPGSR